MSDTVAEETGFGAKEDVEDELTTIDLVEVSIVWPI